MDLKGARRDLRVNCSEVLLDGSPNTPYEAAFADLDALYDEDLDDGEWAVADINSTPEVPLPLSQWIFERAFIECRLCANRLFSSIPGIFWCN